MKWFILLVLFSGSAQAITVQGLIDKYGKISIANVIKDRTKGKMTIMSSSGGIEVFRRPSLEFVNARTIEIDLKKLGLSANTIDKNFTEIKLEKERLNIIRKQELIQAKHRQEVDIARKKEYAEAERIRPKDKYDLAIAKATAIAKQKSQVERRNALALQVKLEKERNRRKRIYQAKLNSLKNPICIVSASKARSDSLAKVREKYPGSYHLQGTLLKGHMDAYRKICALENNEVNNVILKRLVKYYPSFHLIYTLYEGNMKSYNELYR